MLADDYLPIAIFALIGLLFPIIVFLMSRYFRPRVSPLGASSSLLGKHYRDAVTEEEKATTYECGEPTIGSSWVRFNIRFYTIALVYLIFDVEVVFLFPAALVLKKLGPIALFEVVFFVLILVIGLVYAWHYGGLDWVRGGQIFQPPSQDESTSPAEAPPL